MSFLIKYYLTFHHAYHTRKFLREFHIQKPEIYCLTHDKNNKKPQTIDINSVHTMNVPVMNIRSREKEREEKRTMKGRRDEYNPYNHKSILSSS